MSKLIIDGSRRLSGEINIQGSKNSVLPILAASVIVGGESIIHNCPKISDVKFTIDILKHLGCKVRLQNNTIIVDSSNIVKNDIPNTLMREMRSSIIFLGALVSACGSARLSLPGGCDLGPRPIDLHLDGLRQMGLRINETHGIIECDSIGKLQGCNIALSFPSVGATENLILAAVKAQGTTMLTNIAKEPEIIDMINFLVKCGANIKCLQNGAIIINGVKKLHGAEHTVMADRIVAVTYMAAAASTAGELVECGVTDEYLGSVIPVFEEAGCIIEKPDKDKLKILAPSKLCFNRLIRTMPYPGFPTDAQAPVMAMTTIADGTSMFVENIFSSRYKHVGELLRLGADIKVEGKVAIVEGVKKIFGAEVNATDLRGAAALVVAGLAAEGVTKMSGMSYLNRGYENLVNNLNNIGASVKVV